MNVHKEKEFYETAVKELVLEYELEIETDTTDIMNSGVMMPPALAVDGVGGSDRRDAVDDGDIEHIHVHQRLVRIV